MKSSFELLWDWVRKKMNLDEQISKRVDRQMLNELVNENVIPINLMNLKKAAILQPFFLKRTRKLVILKSIHL